MPAFRAGPRHGQGGLGARAGRCRGRALPAYAPGNRPRRRLGGRDDSRRWRRSASGSIPGRPLHAHRTDDHQRPDPLARGHRVVLGLHARAAARPDPWATPVARPTPTWWWDHDECERFADRMQARMEAVAPGFGYGVRVRRVLGPHELQARDANLVGGAVNGGTSQLHQELFFRPVPAMRGRPATGMAGLYLGSASAHPGGGVHGAAGANAARGGAVAPPHPRGAATTYALAARDDLVRAVAPGQTGSTCRSGTGRQPVAPPGAPCPRRPGRTSHRARASARAGRSPRPGGRSPRLMPRPLPTRRRAPARRGSRGRGR